MAVSAHLTSYTEKKVVGQFFQLVNWSVSCPSEKIETNSVSHLILCDIFETTKKMTTLTKLLQLEKYCM